MALLGVPQIRADLGIEKDDYRLPFRKFDTEAFMRSCCDQAFDPSMHITGSPGWAMAKSNAREWQKARDATVNLSVDGEGSVNIALGKPVQVSSVFVEDGQEYGGEKAVNGSKDGWENRWVCRKDDETPWIEVDLQGTQTNYGTALLQCADERARSYSNTFSGDLMQWQESSCSVRYRSGWPLYPSPATK